MTQSLLYHNAGQAHRVVTLNSVTSCLTIAGTCHLSDHDKRACRQGGIEVVAEVRRNWPRTRVRIIAVTADAFEDTREKCLASGFSGWLAKPFRIEDLASVMDAIPQRAP